MYSKILPKKAATVFSEITFSLHGARYVLVLYCGEQIVHVINYMIICKRTPIAKPTPEHLVMIIINCSKQGISIVKIEEIVLIKIPKI